MARGSLAVKARVEKHGLKVTCLGCGAQGRHFPRDGRLRHARCPLCGGTLKPDWWIARFPGRARIAQGEERERLGVRTRAPLYAGPQTFGRATT